MTQQQTIEQIRQHNPTASPEFLSQFDQPALETYLQRLSRVAGHRGPTSRWIRQTTSPAATTRSAA